LRGAHEPCLSDKQQRFIHEYLIDQNARQAAIRAGYSASTQGGTAADLMQDPRIKASICKRLADLFEKLDITAERLMMERARIAFSIRAGCSTKKANRSPCRTSTAKSLPPSTSATT